MEINWTDVLKYMCGAIIGGTGASLLTSIEATGSIALENETEHGEIAAGASSIADGAIGVYGINAGITEKDAFMEGVELGGGMTCAWGSLAMALLALGLAVGGKPEVRARLQDIGDSIMQTFGLE